MSNRVHLLWFRCAFINDLVTYPNATVREHTQRIREEIKCLPDHQNPTSECFPAPRRLLSGGITQFISTPNILQYTLTIVSTENMAKAQMKIRQAIRAKQRLKKFLNLFGMRDLINNDKTE